MKRGMKRGRLQLDHELTGLLRDRDVEDAAEALAEDGWTAVSRLKNMKDEDVGELGVPRGTARALEAVLRSLRLEGEVASKESKEGRRDESAGAAAGNPYSVSATTQESGG